LRTMAISGAICGLAGAIIVCGASHTISTSTANGRGFTAIIVAWMAHFNTFAMLVVSVLLVFMQQGAIQVATQFGLNENASEIITGIILFFLIGSEFFINYKLERVKDNTDSIEGINNNKLSADNPVTDDNKAGKEGDEK